MTLRWALEHFLVETCRQLADELVKSWHFHDHPNLKDVDPGEGEILLARRIIAQKCLYGVDRNKMAANLAKLSLWLITLSKDQDFSFLDHALKHGDSLIGLENWQIESFSLTKSKLLPAETYFEDKIDDAIFARSEIQEDPRNHTTASLEYSYNEYTSNMRLKNLGDLLIYIGMSSKTQKEVKKSIADLKQVLSDLFKSGNHNKIEDFIEVSISKIKPIAELQKRKKKQREYP